MGERWGWRGAGGELRGLRVDRDRVTSATGCSQVVLTQGHELGQWQVAGVQAVAPEAHKACTPHMTVLTSVVIT